ncbi:MAG TPA: hypothetical protein VFF30_04845 [Nitrososphaerales archaeon]|nr:hypothetical protein [Nitrososphaerales archaeon]
MQRSKIEIREGRGRSALGEYEEKELDSSPSATESGGGGGQRLSWVFSLKSTVIISLLLKFAIFLIGVIIIGILNSRTQLTSCGSTNPGNPPVFTSPYGDIEAYTDYRDLYLRCLVTPFLNGSQAYNLPIVYNYPPLFLYTLSIFARASSLIWFPAIPLVAFDALTAIPAYFIASEFLFKGRASAEKLSFAVSLIWIVNPLNLFYNDLMWLNPGPTTFFLMFSIYLFLKGKYPLSAVFLAISTGFKQTSFLLFPVFVIAAWKLKGFTKELVFYILIYAGLLTVISLPYVYQNPQQYFWALQFPIFGNPPGAGSGNPTTFEYDLSQPVRLTTFLGLIKFINLQALTVASYQYLNYVFIAFYVGILVSLALKKGKLTPQNVLVYLLAAFLAFTTFFGRGVYKYYFAGLTPLALPIFSWKKGAIFFEVFCIAILLLPRLVNPWMGALLITFLPTMTNPFRAHLETPEPKQESGEKC